PPDWAEVVVFEASEAGVKEAFLRASNAKIVIKASGIGALDDEILRETIALCEQGKVTVYWDVDAPATLAELATCPGRPLRAAVPKFDAVLTYGGGQPVVHGYEAIGAR